ncbi:MAG TPA: NAD(P)H-hydrate dehydratase [candidate division Zixibacteria bacterium]|nr:NAD(P)H-hydrate dehydratase [candidate division Zixibacteria bacterium]
MWVVTAEEMREMDRLTIERYGVPSLQLMERAGERIVEAVLERYRPCARKGVLVVAGKGNNGGDGFVAARLLRKKRIPCEVALLAKPEELSADAAHNFRAFVRSKGKVTQIGSGELDRLQACLRGKGLLLDAILGTGMKSEVRGLYAEAITLMNACGVPIVAVDVPSGLDADRGVPLGVAIQAEMTVSLGFAKLGLVIHPGIDYAGDLAIADIGIDPRAAAEVGGKTELLEPGEMGRLIPVREADSHKGTYGHLLIVAGSRGKTGAAIMASRAAMRTGAGLVTLAAPRSLNDILAGALVEAMTEPLKENAAEEMESPDDEEWRRLLQRKSALVFGPGIGVTDATRRMIRWLLRNLEAPWVIDADGLNNLALEIDRLAKAKSAPILTPHPGEMARLLGVETAAISRDRVGAARSFAAAHRCYLVLKGARTVIATPEGRVSINPTGNPGMASGGMGDVLAGMIGALLSQGFPPGEAARLGVYLHGYVGDRIAARKGEIGLIASDLIEGLPEAIRELRDAAG